MTIVTISNIQNLYKCEWNYQKAYAHTSYRNYFDNEKKKEKEGKTKKRKGTG